MNALMANNAVHADGKKRRAFVRQIFTAGHDER
jgi:hypothetical protein